VFDDVTVSRVAVSHRQGVSTWRMSGRRNCEDKQHPAKGPATSSFLAGLQLQTLLPALASAFSGQVPPDCRATNFPLSKASGEDKGLSELNKLRLG